MEIHTLVNFSKTQLLAEESFTFIQVNLMKVNFQKVTLMGLENTII